MSISGNIIVIGSGPAGLMAAIAAAGQGGKVKILEALPSPGRKLLASGAGKCNFTNMLSAEEMAERFAPEQRRFVRPALLGFGPEKVREFFTQRGVKYKLVDDFYCFPASEKSYDILQTLLDEAQRFNVEIICSSQVASIRTDNNIITELECSNNQKYKCDHLIAAAGGPGYPKLGGRCSLDKILRSCGVKIIDRTPALCGIKSQDSWLKGLAGIVLDEVKLILDKNNFTSGTLLFTGDGISGPAALDIAGRVAQKLREQSLIKLQLNFKNNYSRTYWEKKITAARLQNGKRSVRNIFYQELPQAIAAAITSLAEASELTVANLDKRRTEQLLNYLTACTINVHAVENWDKSMASTGGADRNYINSKSMQSKQIKNLYFAGEFIDVDGPCGGYNIQWALSSGYLAGQLKAY